MKDNDIEKIIEVITGYFKGTYQGNADLLIKAFHPDARITGIINNTVCDWSLKDFIARVSAAPTAENKKEKYDKEIIAIDKTHQAAMVKARVLVAGLTFFDYIILLKINDNWIIRNKSFVNVP